jgi:uncharacterized protein (DUF433 family)
MTRKINSDPDVMMGKPTFEGTRITVEHVLRMLGMGYTPEKIVKELRDISIDDVRRAQSFAADYLADMRVIAAE